MTTIMTNNNNYTNYYYKLINYIILSVGKNVV